ncbi:phosphotransferase-like protein [Paenibacillus sp. 1001270B_150601_E10]|uniref:phosphotransferase-like protein n=1 Tax=Paenibacillus sp. 1001270B_150601_E10 TaxID=2787079 RepID=UPI00189DA7CF|nr:AAA family ATPase [Paenibacillus sp. 1001270B_150601_E10]
MTIHQPCILIITGIMASGKSTIAQMIAEQFENTVHLRGDIFRKMIVNNRKEVQPDAEYDELEQLRLRYQLTAHAADRYYEAGFTVIVQDVIVGPMLTEFLSFMITRPLYVVVLCPDPAAVSKREADRAKKGYGIWTVGALDHVLRQETPHIGMWLDSTAQTPEQTAADILNRVGTEGLIN